jgi:hypothetical protein
MKRLLCIAGLSATSILVPMGAAAAPATNGVFHPPVHLGAVRHDVESSTNWSGYAVEGTAKFTDARGTWSQPTATCSTSGAKYAAFWVGIDGYSSQSVEQLGTDSDCAARNKPSYYAWYEMYPANSVELSKSKYPVRPGDSLTAAVSVSGSTFTLSLKSSEGWTFSTTQSGSGLAQSSAEWIAEAPEICSYTCSGASLANFGTMSFTNAEAATGGGSDEPISSFTTDNGPHEIIMTTSSGTTTRAQPSALGSGGNNFSIAWKHS